MFIKTKILKTKGDWNEVVNDCRATVSKLPIAKDPSLKFKRAMMICEHSPIRDIAVKWFWEGIPSWVATHFVRHKWEKFVSTQRSDRTGIDRTDLPQSAPVNFTGEANVQHLIDTSRKRLCNTASPETRRQWEDLKLTIHDEVDEIVSWGMVPNCIYRGGCPEIPGSTKCEFYKKFIERHPELTISSSLQERYDAYNADFFQNK